MKNILIFSLLCFAFFIPKAKAQFVADFEFYLYITDALGNKDSVLVGYANNTNISFSDYGTDYGTTPFRDTLEMRVVDWGWQPGTYNRSWKKGYDFWDCRTTGRSNVMALAFSCMHPPLYLSWNDTLFQDDCRDNSTITVSEMYLQHPWFDTGLHVKMSEQSYIYSELDTFSWYRYNYPQVIQPNQIMQSGATDTLFFMFMTFANAPIYVVGVDEATTTGIKAYPTATNAIINIDIAQPEQVSIMLYDLQGQVVKQVYTPVYQLDIADLPAGLYILQIQNGKEQLRQKVVKY